MMPRAMGGDIFSNGPLHRQLHRFDYGYDDHGALASMSFLGRTVAYGHDAHGRLSHVQAPDGEWRYEYDSSGRKKSVENVAAGLLETWDHDELGRLRSITHFDTAKSPEDEGHVIYEAEYSFGPDGRRLAMVERRSSNEASETLWQYEYDGLGRLVAEMAGTRARGSGAEPAAWLRNVRYTYDVDSNRTSEQRGYYDAGDVWVVTAQDVYAYEMTVEAQPRPMSQRLVSIASFAGGVLESTTTFGYSDAGELVSKMVEDGVGDPTRVEVYTWTPKGEMASASIDESGDGDVDYLIEYAYDDRGTLVERTSLWEQGGTGQSVTERYLVDYENPTGYSQVVAEWRQVGADAEFVLARLYSYGDDLRAETTLVAAGGSTGAGGGGPPAHALVPGVQFPLRDALGTVRASAGFGSGLTPGEASINDYRYSAFGLPLGENFAPADASTRGSLTSQSAPSPWAFTGQRIDPATGLQYHRARWLDMALGRWASVDPVWDWGNSGASFSYCDANPLLATDKQGTFTIVEVKVVNAIVSELIAINFDQTFSGLSGSEIEDFSTDENIQLLGTALEIFAILSLAALIGTIGRIVFKVIANLPRLIALGARYANGLVHFFKSLRDFPKGIETVGQFSRRQADVADFVAEAAGASAGQGDRLSRSSNLLVLDQGVGTMSCVPTSMVMASASLRRGNARNLDIDAVLNDSFSHSLADAAGGAVGNTLQKSASIFRAKYGIRCFHRSPPLLDPSLTSLRQASKHNPIVVSVWNGYVPKSRTDLTSPYHAIVVDGITTRQGRDVVAIRDPGKGTAYFETIESFYKRYTARPYPGMPPGHLSGLIEFE